MKTTNPNLSKPRALALLIAAAFMIPLGAQAASTARFDNQSGKPALVKLVGPTAASVAVENGKKESVAVAPGHYFIKVRYGTLGAYSYTKGDEFDVKETATAASEITITLHKVVTGNYGSRPISEREFGDDMAGDATRRETKPPKETLRARVVTDSSSVSTNRAVAVGTNALVLGFISDGGLVPLRGCLKTQKG